MTDQETIERLIDKHGLAKVYWMITDICIGKAEYIDADGQDIGLVLAWRDEGRTLSNIIVRV